MRIRHPHAALVAGAALGAWLVEPGLAFAALALAGGLAAAFAGRKNLPAALVPAALALMGSLAALHTAITVRRVETAWPSVRERLVEEGRRRLDRTLGDAVELGRQLSQAAVAAGRLTPEARFEALHAALRPGAPEHGVTVFDADGRPVAWAGRHRLRASPSGDGLVASIAGYYAVLVARRQEGGWVGVAQVLLAADSVVPDLDGSVAARFARRTSTGLEFFPPRGAPAEISDVFDYCLPECRPRAGAADTLFSVRIVPPTQGAQKLRLLGAGGRRVSVLAAALFVATVLIGSPLVKYAGLAGLAGLLGLTPAGERLGLGELFSPASYYSPLLGSASASAGSLALTGALVVVALVGLRARLESGAVARRALGGLVAAATPVVIQRLGAGVTPPVEGTSFALWVSWEVSLASAAAAMLLLASALGCPWPDRETRSRSWVAGGAAMALAAAGVVLWQPEEGWAWWFLALWVGPAVLAVQSVRTVRAVITAGVVAGAMAAAFTWEAALKGRLALAVRDAARLGTAADPIGAGLLEGLGRAARDVPPPVTGADLYRLWSRSALSLDDYPVVLAAWDSAGRLTARLDLASLDLPAPLLQAIARGAQARGEPMVEALARVPGTHYVLSVPYPSGAVVTVGIGPISRYFIPLRVGRFLRGERPRDPPYEVVLAEGTARVPPDGAAWRRDGWVIRGERALALPGRLQRAYLTVGLRDFPQHVIRGLLLVSGNVALIVLLWWIGESLAGRLSPGGALREALRTRSYRARLALMLAVFFVAPTVGFAAWSVARLEVEARRSARLLTRQTLRDAALGARELATVSELEARERLRDVAARFGADLVLFDRGVLAHTSLSVLEELGLLEPYLPFDVVRHLVFEDDLEATADVAIGGRRTRVAYRDIGSVGDRELVLAAPRLLDEPELVREQEDLVLAVVLATLVGFLAAIALAAMAARSLARPVHVLRTAAEAFGRGGGRALPMTVTDVPLEFVPVVQGLERMAADVRASQAALEAARQRTAAVLRSVATGVVALDRDLTVSIANPRAAELLGVPLGERTRVRDVTGPAWAALWDRVAAFLAGGVGDEALELVVGERRIRAQIASLGDDAGCVVALDDTTDLAHAVRVLAWGELARQIAHEIKNPLTPIRLGVQHLERSYRDRREDFGVTLERTARQILAEIERLDAIARAFARFGAPPAEAGPLAMENLSDVALETAQLYALGADTTVEVATDGAVRARVRRDEFKEVLVNLVENARNAGARRVTIGIARDVAKNRAVVTVRDDGTGIAPEHLPRIFEPQFSTTTSGTGLGLAICRRLTESWGGTITVDSAQDHGTVVTLSIPS
ncbi:MAG TPA: ATP-binding protein [Gemmatimonadales bacterium]|nr:ATP-binding protein [Gemmatimonadales bacterium]